MSDKATNGKGVSYNLTTRDVMRRSITGGVFIDTKLYPFSRRHKDRGTVDRPKPVYTNSEVLKASSSYFQSLLSGGFREDSISFTESPFPQDMDDSTDDYGYNSDSDLDEDETPLELNGSGEGEHDMKVEKDIPTSTSPVRHGPYLLDIRYDNLQIQPKDPPTPKQKGYWSVSKAIRIASKYTGGRGKVVLLPDVAFKTLVAFVNYLYTGDIAFAPLKSQKGHPVPQDSASGTPLCSPKSMYRLADKYGLSELKHEAANAIHLRLSRGNILQELFSTSASEHEEICTFQVAYACSKDVYGVVAAGIPQWIALISAGQRPRREHILAALFQRLAKNMNIALISPDVCNAEETRTAPFGSCPLCFIEFPNGVSRLTHLRRGCDHPSKIAV